MLTHKGKVVPVHNLSPHREDVSSS